MKHRIRQYLRIMTVASVSMLAASCITPPTYDGGDWRNFVGIDRDLCAQQSQEIVSRRSEASLPYFYISSRLPYCAGKIRMTLQRTDKMRYGRFDIIEEGRKFEKEEVLFENSDIIVQESDVWAQQIAQQAALNNGRVILYTHGYNETFLETASRLARFKKIAQFNGPIIQYSWPSHRKALRYATDGTNLELYKPQYAAAVQKLAAIPEIKSLILISHSLGSQLLLHGLQEIDLGAKKPNSIDYSKKITNVILASPDIDKQIFETIASQHIMTDEKIANGRRITVYSSAKDKAIRLSHIINGYERLGGTRCDDPNALADDDLIAIDRKAKARCYANLPDTMSAERRNGLHIIDTTEVSNSNNGHSDFVNAPEACSDFSAVINDMPLSDTRRRSIGKGNIWRLNEGDAIEGCTYEK